MPRAKRNGQRRTPIQSSADQHTSELEARLGKMLLEARRATGLTQGQASAIAGLSQSEWSRLERNSGRGTTPTSWNRAAHAVGTRLDAYIRGGTATSQPRDAVHLRNQELIIRLSRGGQWRPLPEELIDRDARTSRAADVLLDRRQLTSGKHEFAIVEVWDWFDDVGASQRDFGRRMAAAERYAIARMTSDELPVVSCCWVVRATRRNRLLVGQHVHLFRARFSGSGHAWIAALTTPGARLPREPTLLWASVDGKRIFPARLRER